VDDEGEPFDLFWRGCPTRLRLLWDGVNGGDGEGSSMRFRELVFGGDGLGSSMRLRELVLMDGDDRDVLDNFDVTDDCWRESIFSLRHSSCS